MPAFKSDNCLSALSSSIPSSRIRASNCSLALIRFSSRLNASSSSISFASASLRAFFSRITMCSSSQPSKSVSACSSSTAFLRSALFLASAASSLAFFAKACALSALILASSTESSVGTSLDSAAMHGWSYEPHTGQGLPSSRVCASIPAWALRNSLFKRRCSF